MRLPFSSPLFRRAALVTASIAAAAFVPFVPLSPVRAQSNTPAAAPVTDPSLLTIDRVFASGEFYGVNVGEYVFFNETDGRGDTFTAWEPAANGQDRDLVRRDTATGEVRSVLIPAAKLLAPGTGKPLGSGSYSLSADGKTLLLFTNTRRVWRTNSRGDYHIYRADTGVVKKLGGKDVAPSSLMYGKLSPSGTKAGYVRGQNLYVEDLTSGAITQLTNLGVNKLAGQSDWVYEEELSLSDTWRWSADGKSIAYLEFDTSGERDYTLVNATDDLYPKVTTFPYPKAGETNAAVRCGVVPVTGGATRWLEIPGDPRQNYIVRLGWSPGGEVVVRQMNRLQNTENVYLANPATGDVRSILTEKDAAWVDVQGGAREGLRWLPGGKSFLWESERSGWRHLYVVSADGKSVRDILPGAAFDVSGVEGVSADGWVYFSASPTNATQNYLYRARWDGAAASERVERVTPADAAEGWHEYRFSADGKWAVHSFSKFGTPPTTDLLSLPSGKVVRKLSNSDELAAKLNTIKRGKSEFFTADAGSGVTLDGWIMLPPDFDPSKKYPVLFHIYGEPAGATVTDRWGGADYLWNTMLTQQGYIVASLDNRGTPAPKGRAWRKAIYGKIGQVVSADQAGAVRDMLGKRPYLDPARIGVWGWSGGGSQTLNLVFRYPDLYSLGMAVAPVPDVRLYDTIYQERYMGLPQKDAPVAQDAYAQASPVTFASQLKGSLLVVHGTGDDNVHYQGTERLINALVAANKQFTMMAYPNRTHGINEGRNTTRHLRYTLLRYLRENMPPGGK